MVFNGTTKKTVLVAVVDLFNPLRQVKWPNTLKQFVNNMQKFV